MEGVSSFFLFPNKAKQKQKQLESHRPTKRNEHVNKYDPQTRRTKPTKLGGFFFHFFFHFFPGKEKEAEGWIESVRAVRPCVVCWSGSSLMLWLAYDSYLLLLLLRKTWIKMFKKCFSFLLSLVSLLFFLLRSFCSRRLSSLFPPPPS